MKNKNLIKTRKIIWKGISYFAIGIFILIVSPLLILCYILLLIIVIVNWGISNNGFREDWNKVVIEFYNDVPFLDLKLKNTLYPTNKNKEKE